MRDAKDYKNTIEFASEEVHNAWMEEKTAQGFHSPNDCPELLTMVKLNGSSKFVKHCDKCRTDLYPYEELHENIKDYDRVTVIAVLNAVNYFGGKTCADCGYFGNIVPVDTLTQTYREDKCSGNFDDKICEKFAPKGLVEESP